MNLEDEAGVLVMQVQPPTAIGKAFCKTGGLHGPWKEREMGTLPLHYVYS